MPSTISRDPRRVIVYDLQHGLARSGYSLTQLLKALHRYADRKEHEALK